MAAAGDQTCPQHVRMRDVERELSQELAMRLMCFKQRSMYTWISYKSLARGGTQTQGSVREYWCSPS
jgi:hypothetical protein